MRPARYAGIVAMARGWSPLRHGTDRELRGSLGRLPIVFVRHAAEAGEERVTFGPACQSPHAPDSLWVYQASPGGPVTINEDTITGLWHVSHSEYAAKLKDGDVVWATHQRKPVRGVVSQVRQTRCRVTYQWRSSRMSAVIERDFGLAEITPDPAILARIERAADVM